MARLLRLSKWTNRMAWAVWNIRQKKKTDAEGALWIDSESWVDSEPYID